MSLRDITAEVNENLTSGQIDSCQIADVYLDSGIVHYSDMYHSFDLDDGEGEGVITYQPLGSRLIGPSGLSSTQSLDDTAIQIILDSSRITDLNDPIGALLNNPLSQRRVRIREVMFRAGTNRTIPIYIRRNMRSGVVDGSSDRIQDGSESRTTLRIRSGAFAGLERLDWKYSHEDQIRLWPNDTGFEQMAALSDIVLPWRGEFR